MFKFWKQVQDLSPIRISVLGMLLFSIFSGTASDAPPTYLTVVVEPSQDSNRSYDGIPLMEQLAKNLNTNLKYYPCPWARCLKLIENGQADIIMSVFRTPQRDKFMQFLQPAMAQHEIHYDFYHNKGSRFSLSDYSDLHQLRISAVRGNIYFPRFHQDPNLNILWATNYEQAVEQVLKGRADVLIDLSLTNPKEREQIDVKGQLLSSDYVFVETRNEYIGLSKQSDWHNFTEALEAAIQTLHQTGEIDAHIQRRQQ